MKLAVVGAGWAGLSAAVHAADLGHEVTVFEASHTLGGRARAVMSPQLHARIDNGQHIMLGAYRDTLKLIQRLNIDTGKTLQREPLTLESADGTFRLRIPRLPAPFHLLAGLLTAQGLFWRDKWKLARAIRELQNQHWQVTHGITVRQWLDQHQQSARIRALFWHPLCIAALNTPVNEACAQLFANVLRDSLGDSRSACDVVLSKVDLSTLWPEQVENMRPYKQGGKIQIRRGAAISQITIGSAGATSAHNQPGTPSSPQGVTLAGEHFNALIIACNAPSALRLLRTLPRKQGNSEAVHSLLQDLAAFTYVPIATLTLRLASRWNLPRSMYQLHENRTAKHYGQWLFYCPAFMQAGSCRIADTPCSDTTTVHEPLVQVVISDAAAALAEGEPRLVDAVRAQLQIQTRRFGTMPAITGHALIAEKRATFAATPGLTRRGPPTPWPQIWLAGDWTDTGYPAVLEGAVRSGQRAAQCLHNALEK